MYNAGMRSGIECSLCAHCPRDRAQGCCTISPVFLLTDIGYFLNNNSQEFVAKLLDSPYVDVSADQFRVKAVVKTGDRPTCRFHHPEIGCRIPLAYRNTVCRQFLCPDIKLWQDRRARRWVDFWLRLQEEEIRCQQLLTDECSKYGYSLLVRRKECLELVRDQYRLLRSDNNLPGGYPQAELIILDKRSQVLTTVLK